MMNCEQRSQKNNFNSGWLLRQQGVWSGVERREGRVFQPLLKGGAAKWENKSHFEILILKLRFHLIQYLWKMREIAA